MPVPSGRRLWTLTKLWAALRDAPEVGVLAVLLTGGVSMGLYTMRRMYFGPAGDAFPSLEVRKDPELQLLYGAASAQPSIFYKVAQKRLDEGGWNTGVFDNRARPFEYNLPTKTLGQYDTGAGTNVAAPP